MADMAGAEGVEEGSERFKRAGLLKDLAQVGDLLVDPPPLTCGRTASPSLHASPLRTARVVAAPRSLALRGCFSVDRHDDSCIYITVPCTVWYLQISEAIIAEVVVAFVLRSSWMTRPAPT